MSILVHGVCAESSIDKTAGRNGFVWLLGAPLLSCIWFASPIFFFLFLVVHRDESLLSTCFFLECVVGIVDQIHKGEPTFIVLTLLAGYLWALVHIHFCSVPLFFIFFLTRSIKTHDLFWEGWVEGRGGVLLLFDFFFLLLHSCNCYLYLQRYLLPSFPNTIMATYTREGSLRYIQGQILKKVTNKKIKKRKENSGFRFKSYIERFDRGQKGRAVMDFPPNLFLLLLLFCTWLLLRFKMGCKGKKKLRE